MTITAAPRFLISAALARKASSPSFREIEFTMLFPWAFFRPATMVSQWEESIIRAAFATEGSLEMYLRNFSISAVESSMASSMLTSITEAPFSICLAAICRPVSYSPPEMSLANFLEPATLVRSPTFVKLRLRSMAMLSRPLTQRAPLFLPGIVLGRIPLTARASALMCPGVVPQQPPTMLTVPASAISRIAAAVSSGASSYSPISFGRPAFGWQLTAASVQEDTSATSGIMSLAPSEQLRPKESGEAWLTER